MTAIMFDSTEPKAFPTSGFDATAGYVVGSNWPSTAGIMARFPHLPHVTITTKATLDARCLDIEPRNAQNADAAAWLDRQYSIGQKLPILYTSISNVTALKAAVGNRRFLLWTAHWAPGKHLCSPTTCAYPGVTVTADATQFADKGPNGEVIDQSLLTDRFFQAIGGDAPASGIQTPTGGPTAQEIADAVSAQLTKGAIKLKDGSIRWLPNVV
jgi:hypothetical protein